MVFQSKYRKDGTSIHQFKDEEDGEEYLYTQFEAFEAHRAFPCFDQPSLRAVMQLKTLVPKDWVSVSNSKHESVFERGTEEFKIATGDDEWLATFQEEYNEETGAKLTQF